MLIKIFTNTSSRTKSHQKKNKHPTPTHVRVVERKEEDLKSKELAPFLCLERGRLLSPPP
uniref:Uncharacterized protein n=1 Tax=Rhizophora mucronata TaxID=61149 RepID=A0A2P2Q477_RHIMU